MSSRSGKAGGWNDGETHIIANEETKERRMSYLMPHLKKSNLKLLEIGCSSGFMLYPLVKKNIQCIGIEPSGVFNQFCKSKS